MVDILLSGRFKRDFKDIFWTCTKENTWSTSDSIFTEILTTLESHDLGEGNAPLQKVFLNLVYEYSNKRSSEFKKRLSNLHSDPTFHEKLDRTLGSGKLAFRNGRVLDLSSSTPMFFELTPKALRERDGHGGGGCGRASVQCRALRGTCGV